MEDEDILKFFTKEQVQDLISYGFSIEKMEQYIQRKHITDSLKKYLETI